MPARTKTIVQTARIPYGQRSIFKRAPIDGMAGPTVESVARYEAGQRRDHAAQPAAIPSLLDNVDDSITVWRDIPAARFTGIEKFHAAHVQTEARAPIRAMMAMHVDGDVT